MQNPVFSIYHDINQANDVVDRLLSAGISQRHISILTSEAGAKHLSLQQGTKAAEGATLGGSIGGAVGLLAGSLITAATAGVGLLAAGPLVGGLAGMGVGAATGGLTGVLIGAGGFMFGEALCGDNPPRRGDLGRLVNIHVRDHQHSTCPLCISSHLERLPGHDLADQIAI